MVDTVSDTQKHPGSVTVLLKHLCLPLVFRYKIHHIFTGCYGCYSSQCCDQIPNKNEPEEAGFSLAHGSRIQSIGASRSHPLLTSGQSRKQGCRSSDGALPHCDHIQWTSLCGGHHSCHHIEAITQWPSHCGHHMLVILQ